MNKIYIKARAKINLSLEVLNKRNDNYHNIKSVFQKINLYDEIYIEKIDTNKIELETNINTLNNEENTIYKAYKKLKEEYKNISGVKVILKKNIPIQAGLGGGSADCASFILGMIKLFNLKLNKEELETLGRKLGADVVPCFYNTAVLAEGIGDRITPINTSFKYFIVIVKPSIYCNTKKMYELIDNRNKLNTREPSNIIVEGLENNDINLIANNLYNDFEDVQIENDLIQDIKKELLKNGAIGASMTGSGSCVYGIFKNKEIAQKAYKKLSYNYQAYICTSYNSKRRYNLG